MSWKDLLLPASFRGVEFHFGDFTRSGGRRLVEHEFPLRDDLYVEDLGARKREHKFTAYVLGDDYISKRDALESALDQEGAGDLVHPYRGTLQVNIRTWSSKEVHEEGRIARFDIDCVETGDLPSPLSVTNTSDTSLTAGDDMLDQLLESFLAVWDAEGGENLAAALELVEELKLALDDLIAWPGIDTTAIAALVSDLEDAVSDGATFADSISQFFSGYATAVVAAQVPFDEATSSRGPSPVVDPSYGLGAMAAWGETLAPATEGQVQDNQDALVALAGSAATVALSQIYARTSFQAQSDADAARDQLDDLIEGFATTAADGGDDGAYTAWQDLHASATLDITTRAKQAPSLMTFTTGNALPALVLAQRYYQDPTRAGELIARNDAPHPLFMPAMLQALTS